MKNSIVLNIFNPGFTVLDEYVGPFSTEGERDRWLENSGFEIVPAGEGENEKWKREGSSFFVIANESSSAKVNVVYAQQIELISPSVATVESC